ncbi:MAG: DUF456 domain-containing protein [Planctomycetota bacterium]
MPDFGALLLALLGALMAGLGVLLIPFGLPGNWLIAAVGLLGPAMGLGWQPFLVLVAAAAVAEILELLLAVKTVKKAGAGRSGQWGAFLGGIIGAFVGTPLVPVPILGTLLGSAAGAFFGAIVFEILFANRKEDELLGIGWGAFLGILFGKGAKMAIGAFQVVYWILACRDLF